MKRKMKFRTYSMLIGVVLFTISCSHVSHEKIAEIHSRVHEESSEHDGENSTERGEHDRDAGEVGEGEESGTELSLSQEYDEIKNGIRLIISYDKESNSFKGTVKNTTGYSIKNVRVEVHLSNGKELGPTNRIALEAGSSHEILLKATSTDFEGWTTHTEVGNEEHGEGEEGEQHIEEGESHNEGGN